MEFNGWNSFEDFARACGYTNSQSGNTTNEANNNTASDDPCNPGCNDIPNGFQTLNPELFIVIGEILGNIVAGSIPYNVQNAVGNWLELVGQAILTYNAQQQYFQSGPGRYFNPKYYNVTNSFCSTTSTNAAQNNNNNNNNGSSSTNSSKKNNDKIESLEQRINELTEEIKNLKSMIKK